MTNNIQRIPIPNLKVGDLITYRNKPQRIMRSDIPFEGRREVFLSISGITVLTGPPIEVIEHISDDFNIGDHIVIHPIPTHEKQVYPIPYYSEYDTTFDDKTIFQIQDIAHNPYRGTIVQVNGKWFMTYHIEKVADYDIV